MKLFKYLLIIFVVLLITGCNINYNLEISDSKISENISITTENTIENYLLMSHKQYP